MEKPVVKFVNIEKEKQNFTSMKDLFQLKIYVLIKQQYLIRSLSVKKDLNILLATKMQKKQTFKYISPKMKAYRRDFDETKYIFFDKR